jgi:DNA-binding MarR family transcriptional regulator
VSKKDAVPPAPITSGRLGVLTGFAIRRMHQHVSSGLGAILEAQGLRAHEFPALSLIADNPAMSQGDLARALGIKPSNTVPLLDDMEDKGLVRRQEGQTNRRSYSLVATANGLAVRDRTHEAVKAYEDSVMSALSEKERQSLIALARKLGVL